MDAEQAVDDLVSFAEVVDDITSFTILSNRPEAKLISWFFLYFMFKLVFRIVYGGKIWDECSLVHNGVSVIIGFYDVARWDLPESDSCHSMHDRYALVIVLQLVHSVTDFIVFLPEMLAQNIFIWHHLVLIFTSFILPYCPGCYFVAIAYTLAEFGSASIAVDAEWRKLGKSSRGLKRVLVFGFTRVINVYLLYRIYLVTPSTVYFTLSTEEKKVFTMNFPICMITSVGGSVMMLLINGVTWFRMYKSYIKQKKRRMLALKKAC